MGKNVEMTKDGAIFILVDEAVVPKMENDGWKKNVAKTTVKSTTTSKE
jgi:hypothetical protein